MTKNKTVDSNILANFKKLKTNRGFMTIENEADKKMLAAVEFLKHEFTGFRTGRANPSLVENVHVEAYGTTMKLTDIASISVSGSRQLLISPFDASNVHAISKGILAANLNIQPVTEGNIVRVNIPEPNATYRLEMVKQAKKKSEDAKIAIRNIRREANEKAKKNKADSIITEDVQKSIEKKIQELTDKYCKLIDSITKDKEQEITTI